MALARWVPANLRSDGSKQNNFAIVRGESFSVWRFKIFMATAFQVPRAPKGAWTALSPPPSVEEASGKDNAILGGFLLESRRE